MAAQNRARAEREKRAVLVLDHDYEHRLAEHEHENQVLTAKFQPTLSEAARVQPEFFLRLIAES